MPRYFIIFPAGGEGSRISSLTENKIHKSCLSINNKTLMEMAFNLYDSLFNIEQYIVLARENAECFINEFNKESYKSYQKQIRLNIEFAKLGKGGALINAIEHYDILPTDIFIIHNPDDAFISIDIKELLERFEHSNKSIGIVGVKEVSSPYTNFVLDDSNNVISTSKKHIYNPVHCGMTFITGKFILEELDHPYRIPEVFDFEKEWFDMAISQADLTFLEIKKEQWISVNDPKGFKELKALYNCSDKI